MTQQKDDPHVCDALKLMLSENTSIERLHIENSFWQSTNLVSSLLEGLGENNGIRQLSIELDAVVSHFLPSMQAQLIEKIASNTALRRLIIAGSQGGAIPCTSFQTPFACLARLAAFVDGIPPGAHSFERRGLRDCASHPTQ